MSEKLYDFYIPVSWSSYGNVYVQAKDLDDALEKAHNETLPDGEYMDGSFEVDSDFAAERNSEVIAQIEKDKNPLENIVENAFPKIDNHERNHGSEESD
jgi:hypothetical protein